LPPPNATMATSLALRGGARALSHMEGRHASHAQSYTKNFRMLQPCLLTSCSVCITNKTT